MKTLFLLLTALTTSFSAFAQLGTLAGTVKDKSSGEPIIGATVIVKGTNKGAATDFQGNYSIPLDPGAYIINTTYVSYKTATNNVQVAAGKTATLNIALEESAAALEAVSIVGTRQTNTDISLISEIKKSNIVVSGMSAEQIVKAQDRDAAEVVKRIPGITIMDNRFIVVRGLSERYNTVLLNEALTPSSEIDNRAFSFDILPTSVIDRVLVYKSPAPELPGDFAGGAIKIYTKNIVNQNSTTFGFSTSFRGGTTFQDFNGYEGSKTDILGFDNGRRHLPNNFPTTASFNDVFTRTQRTDYGKQLPNIWKLDNTTAAPDLRFNLGMNRLFTIGEKDITSISSVSYSNTRQNLSAERKNILNEFEGVSDLLWDYRDQISAQSVRIGVLQNFGIKLNNNNKLEFRNLFNQIGLKEAVSREGFRYDLGTTLEERNYLLSYESRSILTSQLQGTHTSANDKNIITWATGINYINRDQPDLRRLRTFRNAGSENGFEIGIPYNTPSFSNAGRFYSNLTEKGVIANGQLEHIFGNPDSANAAGNLRMKIGFFTEAKDREFNGRSFGYFFPYSETPNPNRQKIILSPIGEAFNPKNLDPETGIAFEEDTRPSDQYTASNMLGAGYVSLTKTLNKITLYGGVRGEYNLRKLTAFDYNGDASVNDPTFYLLPSLNAAYNFTDRSLVRFAYGMTVNRPEFREQARFTFFDFIEYASYRGSSDLRTATIHNLDTRYEFYPSPSELISIGAFYKHFENPIEGIIESGGADPVYSFANAQSSSALGLEAEMKKSFVDISQSKFIQNHSLVLNASLIQSRVKFDQTKKTSAGQVNNRPLQGQSPYIINAGLYFQDDEKGWQYSLLYNVLGKRIYRVGAESSNPTLYEMPRNVIDFSVTKNMKRGLQLKAGIQDILNQGFRFIQDTDRNGELSDTDDTVRSFKRGSYATFGINYNF